ncbi:MAG: hypothetical protein IID61_14260 [SAR324 cluster bacterium]|nr:hypothetical protein [SAR324 cluster bacterium]
MRWGARIGWMVAMIGVVAWAEARPALAVSNAEESQGDHRQALRAVS